MLKRALGGAALGMALAWVQPGCGPAPGFGCAGDEQCRTQGGATGVCFTVGACGYPDPACTSGYRYSEHAPAPWAGTCVVPDDAPASTGSGEESGGSSSSTDDGGESSSSESGSSSTGPSVPVCGDGIVEGDEECDDGDEIEGNVCNPDCRWSGRQIASFVSGREGNDAASAILRLPSDDVVIAGFVDAGAAGLDAWVARYTPEGNETWSVTRGDTANIGDVATGVDFGPDGSVRVSGYVVPAGMPARPQIWLAEIDGETAEVRWDFTEGTADGNDLASDLVVVAGGDIVMAGRVGPNGAHDFAVRRYSVTDNGDSFTVAQVWSRVFDGPAGVSDFADALAYDPTGRLIVGGHVRATTDDVDRFLVALDLDGQDFDPPCVDNGSDDPLAAQDQIIDVALAPDGAVVAVGRATKDLDEGMDAWIGYYPVGSCSPEWVKTHLSIGSEGEDGALAVAIDDLGRIVVAGYLYVGNGRDAWLAKYEPTGALLWQIDPLDGPANGDDRFEAITFGPGREIIVSGRIGDFDNSDAWVARYTP